MLCLISLGLRDEKDISLRAFAAAKKCSSLYAEFYTTRMGTDERRLSKFFGKPVRRVERPDLEEKSGKILQEARARRVGILVGGDALTATTHISLLLDAKKQGIPFRVIHGSSVFTAIGETGLQLYRFGAATTLAFPSEGYHPTSCYDTISKNRGLGLHTLVLLDVRDRKGRRDMTVREGIETLLEIEDERAGGLFTEETRIAACCCLGSKSQRIAWGKAGELLKRKDLGDTPAVLVIPGKLHFLEKEYLERL